MYASTTLNMLEKDIRLFLSDIGSRRIDDYFFLTFDVLNPKEGFYTDGYQLHESFDEVNINICLTTLFRRQTLIESMNFLEKYNTSDILRAYYRHILNHESKHFINKNLKAYHLISESRVRNLNNEETSIVKAEEFDAERYAIEKALEREDRFLEYLCVLVGARVDDVIILENRDRSASDPFHMPEKCILKHLRPKSFDPVEQRILDCLNEWKV